MEKEREEKRGGKSRIMRYRTNRWRKRVEENKGRKEREREEWNEGQTGMNE